MAQTVAHYLQAHQHTPDKHFPYPECLLEIVCGNPVDSAPLLNPFALTPKEQAMLQWYLSGHSAKEIAQHMQTSVIKPIPIDGLIFLLLRSVWGCFD